MRRGGITQYDVLLVRSVIVKYDFHLFLDQCLRTDVWHFQRGVPDRIQRRFGDLGFCDVGFGAKKNKTKTEIQTIIFLPNQ